jgi:hypothetical protein
MGSQGGDWHTSVMIASVSYSCMRKFSHISGNLHILAHLIGKSVVICGSMQVLPFRNFSATSCILFLQKLNAQLNNKRTCMLFLVPFHGLFSSSISYTCSTPFFVSIHTMGG